jgi:tetratricopeptide (TPR) repeat protein
LCGTFTVTARLRLTRERLRLEQGPGTENQATALREQAERYAGRGIATDYAVQYAVALALLGRGGHAAAYLQAHLDLLPEANAAARDDARLMLGLIAGPGQAAGRTALEQLLAGGADAGKRRMALHLLTEGADNAESRQRLRRALDELLAPVAAHPLTEELLLARAELALADQAYGRAEADARDLLARFPVSPLRARALTQLATAAWELRRFRTAADYAGQAAAAGCCH